MPTTKTGRYSMNPAYAEALDRAEQAQSADHDHDATANQQPAAKGAVKRIEIEPAENGGFVTHTHRQQSDDDGNDDGAERDAWAPPYEEPELRAHPDTVDLMNFLGRELAK